MGFLGFYLFITILSCLIYFNISSRFISRKWTVEKSSILVAGTTIRLQGDPSLPPLSYPARPRYEMAGHNGIKLPEENK